MLSKPSSFKVDLNACGQEMLTCICMHNLIQIRHVSKSYGRFHYLTTDGQIDSHNNCSADPRLAW